MNIIICEDRKEYIVKISQIAKLVFEEKGLEFNIKAFDIYEEAIKYIKSLKSYEDCLYILDIDLKQEKNGLMLGREIRNIDEYKGEMIYVTSYVHQMQSVFKYKLKILDFIDKGFDMENSIREALNTYIKIYKDKIENESLIFKVGGNVFIIKPSDIICIETDKSKKKIIIYTINNEISVNLTLKEIQEELSNQFIQIHRSIIVNKEHIKMIENVNEDLYVVLTGGIREIVSKRREKEIRSCFTQ
ncbi:LytR/AlgR family response regulator transcription factor [Clostridium paridis]|uniref:Stage 0 sporulation protein A homolog n=1 Tax=Clostridium paridis TaxID=2803863 RepID=A0A937FJM9_9CLOT|nr:LytTR family DNA-binding domain-containing protein [Clostridium paridis]MBL4932781.1 response regulator transcription factor [Clostridium paridis]